jgi:hypothetical protein
LRRGAIGNLYGLHEMDSDFRTVDGIVRSFRSEDQDLDTGEHLGKTAITHVELNPPLDASFFAMPRKGDCR